MRGKPVSYRARKACLARVTHRHSCGLHRLLIVLTRAQKRDKACTGVFGTECNVTMSRKDGFDAFCPGGWVDHLERIPTSVEEVAAVWYPGKQKVAVEPDELTV